MEPKTSIDDLATMVQKGFVTAAEENGRRFDGIEKRLDGIDGRLDGIDGRLDRMDARLGRLETDVNELRKEIVYRQEFEDALARIKYMERKLGIESGVE
ncbi:MAG: hypothetical protein HYW90_00905 [Candidatus Sungbacteria bacterium]|nr:hypothetical protein [Candidatus Sungbacteria bacterium]